MGDDMHDQEEKGNLVRALSAALFAARKAATHDELVAVAQGLAVELGRLGPRSGSRIALDGVGDHMDAVVARLNKIRPPSSSSIPAPPPAAQAFHKAGQLAAALAKK